MRRRTFSFSDGYDYNDQPRADMLALWILRGLIHLKGVRDFIDKNGFTDDDILNVIGLSSLIDTTEINRKHAKNILKNRLDRLESKKLQKINDVLSTNITWLAKNLSLSYEEELILTYTILVSTLTDVKDAIDNVNHINKNNFSRSLAVILGISIKESKKSLNNESALISSGLLKIDNNARNFGDKLEPIEGLTDTLLTEHFDKKNILNRFFNKSPDAKLSDIDFEHIQSDLHLLTEYLDAVTTRKSKGVNILIHGDVGVGKTEFVRMLIEKLHLNLYEITMKDNDGDYMHRDTRFSIYQLSQKLLSKQEQNVILFDEIEDVFPNDNNDLFSMMSGTRSSNSSGKKAWINHILENNQTPTFWLSNQISQMDPAYLRRFDYVFELKKPNVKGRKRIINKYLSDKSVKCDWINNLANNEHIVPAFIERAAKVIDHISNHEKDVEHTLDKVIGNTLQAFGHRNKKHSASQSGIPYSIDYLNTDHDIKELCEGIKHYGSGRLCFYGKSGVGKTNLGHHIAEYIDKPLLVKKGSDLISKWVGGTEENIANMFRQATDDNAILLLDEADSFLQNRESAKQSWEITQVNEFLTQMEDFEGIFIASTNLLDILDSASLRRFDFKVKFDYMKHNAAINLFNNIIDIQKWDNTLTDLEVEQQLHSISNLALGDFNVAVRKMRFSKNKTSTVFMNHLMGETNIKKDNGNIEIGFAANIH